jgi:hypothetical protein
VGLEEETSRVGSWVWLGNLVPICGSHTHTNLMSILPMLKGTSLMLLRTCFDVVGVRKVICEMIVKGSGSFDKQSLCIRIKDKKRSLEREGFRCGCGLQILFTIMIFPEFLSLAIASDDTVEVSPYDE